MKIAVCDDCMRDALSVKRFLGGHEARVYSDVDSLLADVKNKKMQYDLYLLDIYMEGPVNGIELAKMLVREQEEAAICFISTSNDFYREAYDLYAVQYLLKPVREEDVKQLLERVSKNLVRNREKKLFFQSRGQTGSIPYSRILYISSREHTLSICCTGGIVQECKGRIIANPAN